MKLPKDLEAEIYLLGGIILKNDALLEVMDIIKTDYFYSEINQLIYQTMIDLFMAETPIDLITLWNSYKDKGVPADYSASLADGVATTANIKHYAKIIQSHFIKRELLAIGQNIFNSIQEGQDEKDVLSELIDKAFAISNPKDSNLKHIKKILFKANKQIEIAHKNNGVVGVSSGIDNIDRILCGFKPKYYVIAGRPGTGKTALALNIAINAGVEDEILIFELEMPDEEIGLRSIASEAMINTQMLENGHVKDNDWAKLMKACGYLHDLNIYIDDSPKQTDLDIWTVAKRHKAKHGLGLVIIDYLQLMKSSKKHIKRQDEIEEISRNLKAMSKDLEVPVVALAQLNRQCDKEKRKPILADLREAGGIEQDADVVMFTHIPHRIDEDKSEEYCELIFAKHRGGPTGYAELRFEKEFTKFSDWSNYGI